MLLEWIWFAICIAVALCGAWLLQSTLDSFGSASMELPTSLFLLVIGLGGSVVASWPVLGEKILSFLDTAIPQQGTSLHYLSVLTVGVVVLMLYGFCIVTAPAFLRRLRPRKVAPPVAHS